METSSEAARIPNATKETFGRIAVVGLSRGGKSTLVHVLASPTYVANATPTLYRGTTAPESYSVCVSMRGAGKSATALRLLVLDTPGLVERTNDAFDSARSDGELCGLLTESMREWLSGGELSCVLVVASAESLLASPGTPQILERALNAAYVGSPRTAAALVVSFSESRNLEDRAALIKRVTEMTAMSPLLKAVENRIFFTGCLDGSEMLEDRLAEEVESLEVSVTKKLQNILDIRMQLLHFISQHCRKTDETVVPAHPDSSPDIQQQTVDQVLEMILPPVKDTKQRQLCVKASNFAFLQLVATDLKLIPPNVQMPDIDHLKKWKANMVYPDFAKFQRSLSLVCASYCSCLEITDIARRIWGNRVSVTALCNAHFTQQKVYVFQKFEHGKPCPPVGDFKVEFKREDDQKFQTIRLCCRLCSDQLSLENAVLLESIKWNDVTTIYVEKDVPFWKVEPKILSKSTIHREDLSKALSERKVEKSCCIL